MSVSVALRDLAARIAERGAHGFLVSVRPDGRPHVVSVVVEWREGGCLAVAAGGGFFRNVIRAA